MPACRPRTSRSSSTSATLQDELQELKKAIDGTRVVSQIQSALPDSYQLTFLVVIALAGVIAAGAGILASTLYTRRIEALVQTARKVGEGLPDAAAAKAHERETE